MERPADAPGAAGEEFVLLRKARSAVRLARHRGRRAGLRLRNLALKYRRHYGMRGDRARRIAAEKGKNAALTAVNLGRKGWRRFVALRKPFIRAGRRSARAREQFAGRVSDWQVEREIRRVARAGVPIIVGPWVSEVGFEALYWIPFLQWLKEEFNLDPRQVVAVSRGGVASWYHEVASTYVEIFSILPPAEFAALNEARRSEREGSHKQLGRSRIDEVILAEVRRRHGLERAVVCHPSLMYSLFRQFWLGHRPLSFLEERARFRLRTCPPAYDLSALPGEYVAVKLYTAASLPATPANREILAGIVRSLAEQVPVVLLDTGLAVDDHADYGFAAARRIVPLSSLMTPENNLGVQTEVISRARAFVGTCGSLAWLAPFLGVDTVALLSDARFLHPHLCVARKAYLETGAASFATVDLTAARVINGVRVLL
jgi:hypothetical protein